MDEDFWNQPAWLARRGLTTSSLTGDRGWQAAGAVTNGTLSSVVRHWSELPTSHRSLHVIVTDPRVYGSSAEIEALFDRPDSPVW
jgi:hypothetical protein